MRGLRRRRLALVVGLVVLLLALGGFGAWRVRLAAEASRERLATLRQTLASEPASSAPAVAPATERAREVCAQASDLDRGLGPMPELVGAAGLAAGLAGRLPRVGGQAESLLALASASADVFAALRLACDRLEPILQADRPDADLASLVAALGDSRDQLRVASERLRTAEARLATVDEVTLDDDERAVYRLLRDRLPPVAARVALLAELPSLLGYDGPRTFLVLGQNSDELRPTGGFVGTSGVVTFDRGRLVRREYGTSSALNVPPDRLVEPPAPLQRYMKAAYWHLQESNWWPDFPSSARQAQYFYGLTRPDPLAGVIALDQDVVALLLELSGPIELPEFGEVVTAENVRERLEYQVHELRSGQDEAVRKRFVSVLFAALADRLNRLPRERAREVATVLERALTEQHLLVWAADDRAQQAIANLGWDGRMLDIAGDYLFPVSANLGMNKVNRDVSQRFEYQVETDASGRLQGRATIALQNHRATSDPGPYPTADYVDYLRLYVPAGSELLAADGFDAPPTTEQECGRTAFGGLVAVPPGQERRVLLTYRLPASLTATSYRLLVQKQPGVPGAPLEVSGLGGPAGGLEVVLDHPRAFGLVDGALVAQPWSAISRDAPSRPACHVWTEPPRVLAAPGRLAIPRLGVQADVVPLGVEPDGTLEAPETGDVVGWYAQSARPGQVGNLIASGHVDWNKQLAVFWRLKEAKPGDLVEVVAEDGARYRYEVQWTRQVDARTPDIGELVGPTTERWLTLITCGGAFDPVSREYADRVVVRARLEAS